MDARRKEVTDIIRKILALALPLMFLTLMAIPAGNAATTPVEVFYLKDLCFVRMRGDPYTQSFLFHYVNLSPKVQTVTVIEVRIYDSSGNHQYTIFGLTQLVPPGGSIDSSYPASYGWSCCFVVYVTPLTIIGSAVIPPPPLPVKVLPP